MLLSEIKKPRSKFWKFKSGKLARYCKKRGSGNLPSSTETNLRDHVKLILTTVETDTTLIRRIGPSRYAVSGPQNSKLFFVPSQATISFPSHLYDDCCDEEEGSYKLKDLDAYSIGTTLFDNALPPKEKYPGSFTLPCIINNLCFNKALVDLGASVSVMPFSTYTKGIAENVLVGIDKFVFPVDFIVLDMSENIKTPLILGRPFLSTTHAKIVVFKRKINLRVGNDKVDFKSDIPTSNIIKRVYALSLIERIELDLKARLLRRNQVDDLEPTIEEGEVVDEPMMDIVRTRCDNEIIDGLDEYPSYEHVNANFFPLLSINVMSKRFYNLIMKDKVKYKRRNVVGAFMNVPIFVGNFSVMTDFAVMENMDSYRDEGMGDIIVGRPFCRDACIKAIRFDGMITIYMGNDSVTYQMVRTHPRFKHLMETDIREKDEKASKNGQNQARNGKA
ncbi:ribonuclease H-like domain, reverse transcriptase, RNA-dependent DNA polymerase [Tanacetum coccineum]